MDFFTITILILLGCILGILFLSPFFRNYAHPGFAAYSGTPQQHSYVPFSLIILLGIIIALVFALRDSINNDGGLDFFKGNELVPTGQQPLNREPQGETIIRVKDPNRIIYTPEEEMRFKPAPNSSRSLQKPPINKTPSEEQGVSFASVPSSLTQASSAPLPNRFKDEMPPKGFLIQIGSSSSYGGAKKLARSANFSSSFVGVGDIRYAQAYKALVGTLAKDRTQLKSLLKKVRRQFPDAFILHTDQLKHVEPASAF